MYKIFNLITYLDIALAGSQTGYCNNQPWYIPGSSYLWKANNIDNLIDWPLLDIDTMQVTEIWFKKKKLYPVWKSN